MASTSALLVLVVWMPKAWWRALLVLGEETRDGRLMGGTHANGIWFF
jgi:hypothetical protein